MPVPVPGLNEPKRRRLVLVEMSRATASPGWRGPCSGKWTFDSRRIAMGSGLVPWWTLLWSGIQEGPKLFRRKAV